MNSVSEKKGVALLLAVLILAVLFSVSLTIVDFVIKQFNIANASRDSVNAIYAADTGIECALFWDIRGREPAFFGNTVFATSTDSTIFGVLPSADNINCLGTDISTIWGIGLPTATAATTTFQIDFSTIDACTIVEVAKYLDGLGVTNTTIRARGYNVQCADRTTDLNAVERAIFVRYNFN